MQCFICVTYMIIVCSGNPTKNRDIDNKYAKLSYVNNFIASFFNKGIPEEINDNEENKLTHDYRYENYRNVLNEADFLPRRNDRIATPPLQYRLPKSIKNMSNGDKVIGMLIFNGNKSLDTYNLKKDRTRHGNKNKTTEHENKDIPEFMPFSTTIAGQSQIGDRESQTVVKPTVIVNIRGSINNREDTKLDKGRDISNDTDITRNVFNINQEINVNSEVSHGKRGNVFQQDAKDEQDTKSNVDFMSMICQPNYWKDKTNKERELDVMEILLTT